MASNMDREMILADFQVKYRAQLPSHLQPRGFPVPKGWPLPSVCLSTAVLCGLSFYTVPGLGCVCVCGVCVCACVCVVNCGGLCYVEGV